MEIPPKHQCGTATDASAHVPAYRERAGRCDEDADEIALKLPKCDISTAPKMPRPSP